MNSFCVGQVNFRLTASLKVEGWTRFTVTVEQWDAERGCINCP